MAVPGETESGSAGTQPDKGYPGRRCAKGVSGPRWETRRGPFFFAPLDTVAIPKKILPSNRLIHMDLRRRTLESEEPNLRDF